MSDAEEAAGGLDLSFLEEEEASAILQVLRRDEALRRAERHRLRFCTLRLHRCLVNTSDVLCSEQTSPVCLRQPGLKCLLRLVSFQQTQSSKRDVKWMHAASGEWFEEIQKKKFKNDPDVRNLVRPSLTRHLRKKPPKGGSESPRMFSSRPHNSPKTSSSGPSLLGLRSPFASFFNFRKSSKQNAKPHAQQERHGTFSGTNQTPVNMEGSRKFEMYQTPGSVRRIAKLFESRENDREPSRIQIEEVFQVLGDLDQTLAQEQKPLFPTLRTSTCYRSRGYSEISLHGSSESGQRYNYATVRDGSRTVSLDEGHLSRATYQPKKFYDMYSIQQRTLTRQPSERNLFGKSPSVCSALSDRPSSSASSSGTFSSSSLQFTPMGQEISFLERTRQHKARRIPVTSIRWDQPVAQSNSEINNRISRAQSSMDLSNANNTSQQNRIFGLYRDRTSQLSKVNSVDNLASQTLHTRRLFKTHQVDSQGLRHLNKVPTEEKLVWEDKYKQYALKPSRLKHEQVPVGVIAVESDRDVEPMEIESDHDRQVPSTDSLVTPDLQVNLKAEIISNTKVNIPHDVTANTSLTTGYTSANKGVGVDKNNQKSEPSTIKDKGRPLKMSDLLTIDIPSYSSPSSARKNYKLLSLSSLLSSDMDASSLPDTEERIQTVSLPVKVEDVPHVEGSNGGSNKTDSLFPISVHDHSKSINILPKPTASDSCAPSFDKISTLPTKTLPVNERNDSETPDSKEPTNNCKPPSTDSSSLPKTSRWRSYLSGNTKLNNDLRKGNCIPAAAREDEKEGTQPTTHKKYSTIRERLSNMTNEAAFVERADEMQGKSPGLDQVVHDSSIEKPLRRRAEAVCEYKDLPEERPNLADTNNNKQSTDILQFSDNLIKKDTITPDAKHSTECTTNKTDLHTESKMSVKPNESKPSPNNVSMTNQQNLELQNLEKRHIQSKANINQTFVLDLPSYGDNKKEESMDTDMSAFPSQKVFEERLKTFSSGRNTSPFSTQNKSTISNLLKDHLLLAPEPYKSRTNVKENTPGQTVHPEVILQSIENPKRHLGGKTNREDLTDRKAYAVTRITENTQVYETFTENTILPDTGEIAYHKSVSVYYSLPHEYSKELLEISQNQVKNVDSTLEMKSAPSALLEKIGNWHDKSETQSNLEYPNTCKSLPYYSGGLISSSIKHSRPSISIPVIPLETSLPKKVRSQSFDILDSFDNLKISEEDSGYYGQDSPPGFFEKQKHCVNENYYMDFETSGRNMWNSYTMPNKRTRAKSLEQQKSGKALSPVHDNIFMGEGNFPHASKSSKSLTSSPDFGNSNLAYSMNINYPYIREPDENTRNMTNLVMTGKGIFNKNSTDEGFMTRERALPVYRSKSLKDVNGPEMYYVTIGDNVPGSEWNSRQPLSNKSNQVDKGLTQRKPSYCSQFVQNQMKSAKVAKKSTFSFDNSDQHGYGSPPFKDTDNAFPMTNDYDSTTIDNYKAHLNKTTHKGKSPSERAILKSGKQSNLCRSKSMKTLLKGEQDSGDSSRTKGQQFSSKSYGENLNRSPSSVSNSGDVYSKPRLSSDPVIDVNDNWPTLENRRKPVCTSKSLDYGIFDKDQQEILLNNVKKSLTEGRLWRPSFLKNPGFLGDEEKLQRSNSPTSPPPILSPDGTLNIYKDTVFSDSDNDTTTDDEYYLTEHDKESEL
uniref:RabBD domain-containing protein n=1 Tax=Leptobrachium leishanense TaxID=445787 RepID=A0A8C5PBI1_9ANUR